MHLNLQNLDKPYSAVAIHFSRGQAMPRAWHPSFCGGRLSCSGSVPLYMPFNLQNLDKWTQSSRICLLYTCLRDLQNLDKPCAVGIRAGAV